MKIYLAGKIGKNDWRHDLVKEVYPSQGRSWTLGLREIWNTYDTSDDPWPIIPQGVLKRWDYVGPYFLGCDHGCAHGPGSHGVAATTWGDCAGDKLHKDETVGRCLKAIDAADVVFAWLDDPTAYGTLAELGYAVARGKRVIIAHPSGFDPAEFWFVMQMADLVVSRSTAAEALEHAAKWYGFAVRRAS